MLTHFRLEKFKGIANADLDLKQINILIGVNGTGKSSVGQALLLLKQSGDFSFLNTNGEFIRLGDRLNIFFEGDYKNKINISIGGNEENINFFEKMSFGEQGIEKLEVKFQGDLNMETKNDLVKPEGIALKSGYKYLLRKMNKFAEPITIGREFSQISQSEKEYYFQYLNFDRQEFEHKIQIIKRILNNIWFVPALRGTLKDYHKILANESLNITPHNDQSNINDQLYTTLGIKTEKLEYVSKLCEEVLGIKLNLKLTRNQQISLKTEHKTKRQKQIGFNPIIVNQGFGLNQLILLFTQLVLACENSLVIIDEPEIHLHPKAQIKLAEVLIREALKNNKQLLISTHSEHILYQALTMIAKGNIKFNELGLFHFSKKGNSCYAKKLFFNERGRLEEGLPDFFDVNIEQFKAYLDAINK